MDAQKVRSGWLWGRETTVLMQPMSLWPEAARPFDVVGGERRLSADGVRVSGEIKSPTAWVGLGGLVGVRCQRFADAIAGVVAYFLSDSP